MVRVGSDEAVRLPHIQAEQSLDRLRSLFLGHDLVDAQACERFGEVTKAGCQVAPTLVRRAAERSIFLAPEAVFYPEQQGRTQALRINVAYAGDERFVWFLGSALGGISTAQFT